MQSWVEAAEQLHALSADFLRAWQSKQVQLDARSAVLSALRAGALSAAEAVAQLARSPAWGWTAIAPETQLLWRVQGGSAHVRVLKHGTCYASDQHGASCRMVW